MKTAILSFTKSGYVLAGKIAEILVKTGHEAFCAVKCEEEADSIDCPAAEWVKKKFQEQDALFFVGAAGIAVRLIAPYVSSKTMDPAVLVVDEKGDYCIPLLSGHIGGANELARLLGRELLAVPVITTATDIRGKWAVDVFAVKNGLRIESMEKAKRISAKLLGGSKVTVCIDEENGAVHGYVPDCIKLENCIKPENRIKLRDCAKTRLPDVKIGIFKPSEASRTLYLIPRAVCVGIGCRKGTPEEKIEKAVCEVLKEAGIWLQSIEKIASIHLKADEKGILTYCDKSGLRFETYSAEELKEVQGTFSSSEFVEQTTGVENVCERSAVKGSGDGLLLVKKQVRDGVTVAAAVRKWSVYFE